MAFSDALFANITRLCMCNMEDALRNQLNVGTQTAGPLAAWNWSTIVVHSATSRFVDCKKLQVTYFTNSLDAIPDGQTPSTITMCLYDELVDEVNPGDRVVITGIYRAAPVRVNPTKRTMKSVFRTYLDVLHVQKTNKKQLRNETDDEIQHSAMKYFSSMADK